MLVRKELSKPPAFQPTSLPAFRQLVVDAGLFRAARAEGGSEPRRRSAAKCVTYDRRATLLR